MFCPNCGQERLSTETSFCSRCGFLLTGTADILQMGGLIPRLAPETAYKPPSPRSRGVKQGLFILLLSILIVPLLTMFAIAIRLGPGLPIVATILLVTGGLLRMAYAWMFESPIPGGRTIEENANYQASGKRRNSSITDRQPVASRVDRPKTNPLSVDHDTCRRGNIARPFHEFMSIAGEDR